MPGGSNDWKSETVPVGRYLLCLIEAKRMGRKGGPKGWQEPLPRPRTRARRGDSRAPLLIH